MTEQQIQVLANKPIFANPIISELYVNNFHISQDIISQILALPRESLLADLQLILRDAVVRYEDYLAIDDELRIVNCQVFHVLFLLTELQAEESLDWMLEFYSHHETEELLDFWLGDATTTLVWQYLLVVGKNQLKKLGHILQNENIYLFLKTEVSTSLKQIQFYYPEKRNEVYEIYKETLAYYLQEEKIYEHGEIVEFVISDVLESGFEDLLETIKPYYAKVYHGIIDLKGCNRIVKEKKYIQYKKPLLIIKEMYEEVIGWGKNREINFEYDDDMEEEEEIEDDQDFDFTYDGEVLSLGKSELNSDKNPTQISVRDTPKIGRNDVCPCGSGKKYKKCCGVNQ